MDDSGSAYVTGSTASTDFPTANAFEATNQSIGPTAFVTKLSPDGSALVYSTYLGGGVSDGATAITVDPSGNAYVTGETQSPDFPLVHPFQSSFGAPFLGGVAFVTKIDAPGNALDFSTFLGGTGGSDQGNGIGVDGAGNVYVAGRTNSTNFPTRNAIQASLGGGTDAFVTELKNDGQSLIYSTYLGGSGDDSANGIAVTSTGNAFVAGATASANFPTRNALQPSLAGADDAFVAEIQDNGASLVYSTYVGGGGADHANGVAFDSRGNAYVTGDTASTDFPTKDSLLIPPSNTLPNSFQGGVGDAFVSKVSAGGSLVYSLFLGGNDNDVGRGIAVDTSGNAYVVGTTNSLNFPTASGDPSASPFQPANKGNGDAFVCKVEMPNLPNPQTTGQPLFVIGTDSQVYI